MKYLKKISLLVALIAAVGLVYYFGFYRPGREEGSIRTSGHVEVTEVDLSFRLPGHLARLLADEGDQVAKGALLAELDQDVLRARRDQSAAVLDELDARRESLDLAIQIKEEVLAAQEMQAAAAVSAAEARYRSLKSGSRREEVREAAASLERARTEHENRQRDFARMKQLYERKIIPTSQFEDSRTAMEAAGAGYDAVLERYRLVRAGPRKEMVSEGEAQVDGSDAALKAAQAGRREVARMKLDLKALLAQVEQARAGLAVAESDLAESRLSAPFTGFITVRETEVREFVQAGAPVMTVANLDRVWVKTYVPETLLGLVRLGQKASVFIDGFPDKAYPGTLTFISPEAEFTPKNVQTREERVKLVYRLKISLDNPNQELKAGMPVDVVIETGR
ncbi:MAG: efflux RND transporter periplasmic adaptor subunit [Proteobacteria bacterium]|nr:efflux RND transporter periplasmic adaptor subunit [Pseudomonadota bacterium]